jgi:hypothetical protein
VDVDLIATGCSMETELLATVPASDFATSGSEQVSLSNLEPDGGTSNAISLKVAAAPAAAMWVRAVADVTVGWGMVWDSVHSGLYVSTAVQDPKYSDMLVPINPVTAAQLCDASQGFIQIFGRELLRGGFAPGELKRHRGTPWFQLQTGRLLVAE